VQRGEYEGKWDGGGGHLRLKTTSKKEWAVTNS
jgi:hypothetical protein